jgi:hypothetical protein
MIEDLHRSRMGMPAVCNACITPMTHIDPAEVTANRQIVRTSSSLHTRRAKSTEDYAYARTNLRRSLTSNSESEIIPKIESNLEGHCLSPANEVKILGNIPMRRSFRRSPRLEYFSRALTDGDDQRFAPQSDEIMESFVASLETLRLAQEVAEVWKTLN